MSMKPLRILTCENYRPHYEKVLPRSCGKGNDMRLTTFPYCCAIPGRTRWEEKLTELEFSSRDLAEGNPPNVKEAFRLADDRMYAAKREHHAVQ